VPHQLNLLDRAAPQPEVWDQLNDAQRTTVIDTMARLIGKAIVPTTRTTNAIAATTATVPPQEATRG
jgi:hypothetical protein